MSINYNSNRTNVGVFLTFSTFCTRMLISCVCYATRVSIIDFCSRGKGKSCSVPWQLCTDDLHEFTRCNTGGATSSSTFSGSERNSFQKFLGKQDLKNSNELKSSNDLKLLSLLDIPGNVFTQPVLLCLEGLRIRHGGILARSNKNMCSVVWNKH